MTTSAEFLKDRETRRRLDGLTGAWLEVTTLINNNRLHDALALVAEVLPVVDEAGDSFTVTQYPPCLGCTPPGSAEVLHPTEPQRKLVCYLDSGDVGGKPHCRGNQFGRMHPVQLREYIEGLIVAREPRPLPEGAAAPEPEPAPTDAAPPEPQTQPGS